MAVVGHGDALAVDLEQRGVAGACRLDYQAAGPGLAAVGGHPAHQVLASVQSAAGLDGGRVARNQGAVDPVRAFRQRDDAPLRLRAGARRVRSHLVPGFSAVTAVSVGAVTGAVGLQAGCFAPTARQRSGRPCIDCGLPGRICQGVAMLWCQFI